MEAPTCPCRDNSITHVRSETRLHTIQDTHIHGPVSVESETYGMVYPFALHQQGKLRVGVWVIEEWLLPRLEVGTHGVASADTARLRAQATIGLRGERGNWRTYY